MVRLTEKSKTGLWHLRGVSWEQLRSGHKITKTVSEKIYGALCKLKDYEDSGMNPDQAAKAAEKNTPTEPKEISAWRYTDDNRFGYAYVWEQAKILKMISDKLREKDVPVPEVKLIRLW